MDQIETGKITLSMTAELVFSVGQWKGRRYAFIRKYIDTAKYTGPTKSGVSLKGNELIQVIEVLNELHSNIQVVQQEIESGKIKKSEQKVIVIRIIPSDDSHSLPEVDIREYIESSNYCGPTKKGIRFQWDKLSDIVSLMKIQVQLLVTQKKNQMTLFTERQPEWVGKSKMISETNNGTDDLVSKNILPCGPKEFPADFMDNRMSNGVILKLPGASLEISNLTDGKCVIRSDLGFCHDIRNVVEGNFIIYAWMRGHKAVQIPQEMIIVFKAVKAYENYLRELRKSLIQEYQNRCKHRSMAEYKTKELFKINGLPWLEES